MAMMNSMADADGGEAWWRANLTEEDNFSSKEAKIETQNRSLWRKRFVRAEEARCPWNCRWCEFGRMGDKSHKAMAKMVRENSKQWKTRNFIRSERKERKAKRSGKGGGKKKRESSPLPDVATAARVSREEERGQRRERYQYLRHGFYDFV
jgi:hypothetical protein